MCSHSLARLGMEDRIIPSSDGFLNFANTCLYLVHEERNTTCVSSRASIAWHDVIWVLYARKK